MNCKIHPKYKAVLPPRSTKPDCTCKAVYDARNA